MHPTLTSGRRLTSTAIGIEEDTGILEGRRMNRPKCYRTDLTGLLTSWQNGDRQAMNALIPLIYRELRCRADHYLKHERPNHTLSGTALVNETFLELCRGSRMKWKDRNHFFAVAAKIMRNRLAKYARDRHRIKRLVSYGSFSPDIFTKTKKKPSLDLVRLTEGIRKLEKMDARKAQILLMHHIGGFKIEEIAEILSVSVPTIKRNLCFSRAWLRTYIRGNSPA